MKKHLLILASAALASSAAWAQDAPQPMAFEDVALQTVSPNGAFAAGSNPYYYVINVLNVSTGDVDTYGDGMSEYLMGSGINTISNDGIVIICTDPNGSPDYIENGEVKTLPMPKGVTSAYSNSITPDGSRIAGTIGIGMSLEAKEVMQHPVIWNRLEDGTYSEPVILPYPTKDFTGRLPQYVLADGISADGKTIACQVVDNCGMFLYPVVITEDENGNWSYKEMGLELIVPEGVEFPEATPEPNPAAFMSPEQREAYLAAVEYGKTLEEPNALDYLSEEGLAAYYEELENYGYAWPGAFMTEEESEAYDQAMAEYYAATMIDPTEYLTEEELEALNDAMDAYAESESAINDIYYELFDTAVAIEQNQFCISPDGRHYATVGYMMDYDTGEQVYRIYVFDTATGEFATKDCNGKVLSVAMINDNRGMLVNQPATWVDPAQGTYVCESFDSDYVLLTDYLRAKDENLYAWAEENMYHTYYTWDDELEDDVENEAWFIGEGCATPDFSTIITWAINMWDYMTTADSYYFPIKENVGVSAPMTNVKADAPVEYFNLQGIRIEEPTNGLYIRRQGTDVTKVIVK